MKKKKMKKRDRQNRVTSMREMHEIMARVGTDPHLRIASNQESHHPY